MPLKKTALAVFMIVTFAAYAHYERAHNDQADLITLIMRDLAARSGGSGTMPDQQSQTSSTQQPTSQVTMTTEQYAQYIAQINAQAATNQKRRIRNGDDSEYSNEDGEEYAQQTAPVQTPVAKTTQAPVVTPAPAPVVQPTPAPVAQTPRGTYRDGSYTGPSIDVYYGIVQVRAVVSGGKLTDVTWLQYPNDRSHSVQLSQYAMPILTQEAIQAQSAQVDGVSGASATSDGFVQSLRAALSQAA